MLRFAQNLLVWLTALSVGLQSLGSAAGGFVCIGCPNTATGVALASSPCDEGNACCSNETAVVLSSCDDCGSDSCTDQESHSQAADCACVDISIPANGVTVSQQPFKVILTFVALADPIPAMVSCEDAMDISPLMSWTVRGGPPTVRLLAPSSRQTVLLI